MHVSVAYAGQEVSEPREQIKLLLGDALSKLPCSVEELKAHFSGTADLRVPVDENTYNDLLRRCSNAIRLVKKVPASAVTRVFNFLLMEHPRASGSTELATSSRSIMMFFEHALGAFKEYGYAML